MTETPELSVLAQQRAEDAALCERLRSVVSEEDADLAAGRLAQRNTDLAEACHERDKAVADSERWRDTSARLLAALKALNDHNSGQYGSDCDEWEAHSREADALIAELDDLDRVEAGA